ncbi:11544_t:CDS:1, partial [Racocetra fulgida]
YSWFLLHRGDLSVLVHPLTKEQVKDHTNRATWLGASVPVDVEWMPPVLNKTPLQYPELGLGYSALTEYLDSNEYSVLEE